MSHLKRTPLILTSCFLALTVLPLYVFALEYVESSSGLQDPQWDGGQTEIEMADINLDGNIDLISIGDHGSPYINTQEHGVMVYFGDGRGHWNVYQNGNFGYGGVCVGDVNDDGLPDIGYAMHHNYSSNDFGDQLIEVALGDGTGQNWTPWDDGLASQGEDYGMFATDFGDVDNDGDLDIAATSFGSGNPLMIYLNDGDGTWTHSAALTGSNCSMVVSFGDINKDGNLDVAASYQNGSVFFGNGDGTFYNAMYNLPSGSLPGLSLADMDNDGGMDLSFVLGGQVEVWVFDEVSTRWLDYTGNLPAGSFTLSQLHDMNADGFCDVVAAGSGSVSIWTGDGSGYWTFQDSYVIDNDPDCYFKFLRVGGDVDHNGYPDIVHLSDEGSWINSYNHLRLYKESSQAQDLAIVPYYPRGGEVFPAGSVRFTDWISAVPFLQTSTVTIELSTDGLSGPWNAIATDLPNNGRHQWTIPQSATSTNCYLRYTVVSEGDTVVATTPQPFTILGDAPNVQIALDPVNPPIIIPANGGAFEFEIAITNNEAVPTGCDIWTDITLPNGHVSAPIINVSITIPVGTVSRTRIQQIPALAPPGEYSYNGYVGIYPNTVWSTSNFDFEKSDGTVGMQNGSWANHGEPFDFDKNRFSLDPSSIILPRVHPNPFNPTTTITFDLPVAGNVRLEIFDIHGRRVGVGLAPTRQYQPGHHQITFDGSNLPSGVYIYHLQAGEHTASGKIVLMK